MSSFKCSAHDMAHVERVASLALHLADKEMQRVDETGVNGRQINMKVVYIASLCHDVLDAKLVSSEDVGSKELVLKSHLLSFLSEPDCNAVFEVINAVGYRNLLDPDHKPGSRSLEYQCVQDADLLDAIGAVGVSRCYSFGGGITYYKAYYKQMNE
jgi:uncharacterized protein